MGRRGGFSIGVLIVLWLAFFWRQIAGGEVWYCCDNLLINVPSRVFFAHELKAGRFPLWNPYLFSGTPFFADINLSLLHPFNLLYLIFAPFRALTVSILALFLVASVGMYWYGRTLRFSRFASLFGAIAFGFSGSLVVYANNVSLLQVAALLPWVLAAWTRGRMALFVLVASFQVLSGHPQLTFLTWLLLLCLSWRDLGELLRAGLWVFGCTAMQVVPFVLFALSSTRIASTGILVASASSVHPLSVARLFIPALVGDLSRGTAWVQGGTIHGYVGFLPLVLALGAWRQRRARVFLMVAALSLLASMSPYDVFFRQSAQFLLLWEVGICVAAMYAVDRITRSAAGRQPLVLFSALLPRRLEESITAFPEQAVSYNLALISAFSVLCAGALLRLRSSAIAKLVLLGVLFADLSAWGHTNVTTIPESSVMGWYRQARERLASWNLAPGYRYYTDPALYPYPGKKPLGQYNDPGESAWQFLILRPGIGMLYGLPAVDGYASMVLRSYQQRFGGDRMDPTGVVIPSIDHPLLPKLGVRYLITKPNNVLLSDAAHYHLLATDGTIAVYEDRRAAPVTSGGGIEE